MKKYIIIPLLVLSMIACGNDQEGVTHNEGSASTSEESNNNSDVSNKSTNEEDQRSEEDSNERNYIDLEESELLGEYIFQNDEINVRVQFDKNGTLRVMDNSGNMRYSLRNNSDRIVIDSNFYRMAETEYGYYLVGIDENGIRTHEDIRLTTND